MPPHGSPKAGQSQLSPTKPGGKSPEKGHRRPPLKYPKLVADKGPDTTKLPPSEMLFPSEEAGSATVAAPRIIEFLNIADYTHNVSTIVPVEEPLFQPSPMHILFKSFEPQQVYSAKLCFRNNDYVGRRMKIQEIRSAFFHVKRDLGDDKGRDKVAPGMEVSYTITFTPQDPINYEYDMVVVTEREKFIVPLKALGPRPRFDFPDLVEFPLAPVRVETSKVLLVRNVGNASGSFTCTAAEPFFISPQTCVLDPQEAVQVTVTFFPDALQDFNSDVKIQYSSDEVVYMKVSGTVQELNVGLEASIVEMDNTYVTLFSQKTFKIYNKSDLPVQFEFKSLSSTIEDEKARARFRSELSQSLPDFVTDVEFEQYEEDVASMPLHFEDSAFKFEPLFGEVWPGCTRLVQITFSPVESVDYSATSYLQVQGKESRLPLQLSGSGIGAKLFLSHTVLSVGEVIVRTENEYEFWLENLGDIPATFEYAPQDTSIAPRFTFTPSSGLASVGAKIKVKAVFYPEQRHLGDFEEPFQWFIQGSPKPRIITFRGKVVTPTFYLDSDMLDYGRVSAGFMQSRSFNIFNTSPVPFRFHCRIPGDGALLQREFDPVPETGVVLPGGKYAVRVDFVSTKVGLYDLAVDIDLEGVGESLQRLPIVANSVMPDVAPNVSAVNFGECFLQYEHKKFIELINSSDLPVKFDVVPQDSVSASVAKITVDQLKGTIMGKKELLLCVTLCVKRLGKLQLPLKIRVVGMESRPLEVVMTGIGIGPRLEIPSDDISWGNIPVLQSTKSDVVVRNTGLISAHIRPIVGKKGGPFTIPATHKDILLEPNVEVAIPVFALLNDCTVFKDQLVLMVDDGPDIKISLNAKGTGTTLWCDHQLSHVELGPNFSQRTCQHSFVLVNRGPKAQQLTWSNEEEDGKKKDKKDSKDSKDDEEKSKSIFRIEPDKSTLEPGANATFTIVGLSPKEGFHSQKILGKVSVDRNQMVAFEMVVDSTFINPLLQMSQPAVSYNWTYSHESPFPHPLQESITVTNISKLSLSCIIKTAIPFSCHPEDIFLEPGASSVVTISFEPGWKGDHCSVIAEGKLQFSYKEHPQKDSVSLVGNVVFPNLSIAQKSVEFGTILSDTSKRNLLRVVNNEPIDVTYSWSLSVDEGYSDEFPIGNIFDIVPSRATLRPGEVQDVEVIFQSQKEKKFECFAVASVVGGPTYDVKLKGSGGQIKYSLEPNELSLGGITFDKPTDTEILITNSGKVKIDFSLDTSSILPPSFVVCSPSSGIVGTNEKVKVAINVTPGTPDEFEFEVMVRIAHYSPVPMKIKCQGILPMLIFDLARKDPVLHAERLALAIAKLGPKPDAFENEWNSRKEAVSAPPSRPATQGSKRSQERLTTLRYIRMAETEADLLGMRSFIQSQVVENQHKLTHSRLGAIVESSSVATFDVGDPKDLEDVPPFFDAAESQNLHEDRPPRSASTVPVVPSKQLSARIATAMRHETEIDDMLLCRKQINDAIQYKHKEIEELTMKVEIQKSINPKEARKLQDELDRKVGRLASLQKDLEFINIGIFVINSENPDVLERDFQKLDNNGNGICSYSEVQTWLVVNYPFLNQRQVISQAFYLAKNEDGFVTKETFALLCKHLGQGIRAVKFFNQMDVGGRQDRKISQKEFIEAINRLISATQDVHFDEEAMIAQFKKIDANGGGEILFNEFYSWLESVQPPVEMTVDADEDSRPPSNLADSIKIHLDAMVKPVSLDTLKVTPRLIPPAPISKKRLTTADVSNQFFASEYVCDFGHVIKGATKKRVFSASNTSAVPVNFELDKKAIQDCKLLGFSVDPAKMNKFPGGPDAESIDVTITFNSIAKDVPLGRLHYPLLIQIKNGPKMCIHLEAFVTIPEVDMSVESIAFGSLMCGRSKIHTIQLTNIKTVPCDWSFSEAIDGVRACQAITAHPSSGTLQPGEQINCAITFTPSQSKVINAKMMLKVNANQVKKTLKIKAQGVEPLVTFEPAHLTFKPILPLSGLSAIDVTMVNSCSEELEVLCSELDAAIEEEEEMLKSIDCFGSSSSILLPVRMPGQPLPREVTEWITRKRAIAAAAAAPAPEDPAGEGDAAEGVGEVSVLATTSPRGVIFLVHGKPSLQPSALAASIGAKYRVPALTIDEIVAESITSGSELGLALVASLEAAAKAASAPAAAAPVDPKAKGKAPAPAAPVEEAKVETVLIGGTDVAKVDTLTEEVSDHLRTLVRSRLERDDCSLGAVLHSVSCSAIADNAGLLNMMFKSLTKECDVILVTPQGEAAASSTDSSAPAQNEETSAPEADGEQPAAEAPEISNVDELFDASSAAMDAAIQQAKERAAARPAKNIDWAGLPPLDAVPAASDAGADAVPDLAVVALEVPVAPVNGDFSSALQALVDDCVLPLPEPLPGQRPVLRIPAPVVRSILPKMTKRVRAKPSTFFELVALTTTPAPAPAEGEEPGADVVAEEKQTRWVMKPGQRLQLRLKFSASDCGDYDAKYNFEILGAPLKNRDVSLSMHGVCAFPTISDDYRTLYYRKVKQYPASSIVHRQFVLNPGVFDFGPLILGKTFQEKDKFTKSNSDKFRITNTGLFDLNVKFDFEKSDSPFSVEPSELTLGIDECRDVVIWAFPTAEAVETNNLVCVVEHNPKPVVLPVSCRGCKPSLSLEPSDGSLKFERLLVKRKDTKTITLSNPTQLPVKWSVAGVEALAPELFLSDVAGTIEPLSKKTLEVSFTSPEPKKVEKTITFIVSDAENLFGTAQELPVKIEAEAYHIEFDLNLPKGQDKGVDFGTVRVSDKPVEQILLQNKGLYAVGYSFQFKKASTGKYFTFSSQTGTLEPGAKDPTPISINFACSDELDLKDNTDLRCLISEATTGEVILPFTIKINVKSVFSLYKIMPSKGVNFGAVLYNTSKQRTFDIVNNGVFDFQYKIVDWNSPPDFESAAAEAAPAAVDPKAKAAPPAKGAPAAAAGSASLTMGAFSMTPASGIIAPGSSAAITVNFDAKGAQVFSEKIAVRIAQAPADFATVGEPYELVGESCIPGISTSDWDTIFEEQEVVRRADASVVTSAMFFAEERSFNFGPVVVGTQSEQRFRITNPFKIPCTVDFAIKAARSAAAAAADPKAKGGAPASGGDALNDGSAFEVQPSKLSIPTHEFRYVTVYFNPKSLETMSGKFEGVVDGGSDTKSNLLAFSLRGDGILPRIKIMQPSETDADGRACAKFGRLLVGKSASRQVVILNDGIIPASVRVDTMVLAPPSIQFTGRGAQFKLAPGEKQQFELTFNPREAGAATCEIKIAVHQNQFEDSVISVSGDAYERDLSFEDLGGQESSDSDKLVFGGTPVCVPVTKTFNIQNRTSQSQKFEWPNHSSVTFVPRVGHLLPHSSKQITATFESKKKLELVDDKVDLSVKIIEYAGDIVDWDESSTTVSWVAVGKDGSDSLENTGMSQSSPKRRGNKKVVEPTPEPEVTVKEGSDQNVPLLISANADALVYELGTDSIKLKSTMMFQTRAFSFPFKNTSTVPLEFSWAFEKDSEDPWEVSAHDGSEPVALPDPFVVEPAAGTVAPGQSINVQVHFSPQEAGPYSRRLIAKIPHLDTRPPPEEEAEPVVEAAPVAVDPKAKGKAPAAAPVAATKVALPDVMQPPVLSVTARAMRPLCHFELVESDWISGGRRPSGLPGPGGKSSLDPSTRVVEFESLGTKVRNTKRFFVTNPTNQSYEYSWECGDGSGAAALLQQRTFRCAQRKGVVLAGKKAEMVFEYTPEEDMLLESFWRFNIPEHNISVPVMLVGHVKEPSVAFSVPFLNFNAILVGAKATQTVNIVNKEHLPFQFTIDAQSLGGDSGGPALVVSPMTGMVSPGSSFPLMLTFTPKSESIFNINVSCNVRNKVSKLTLNVKGEGFVIRATVSVDDSDAGTTLVMVPNRSFPLKYGQVYLKEKKVKVISITNGGKYPFDYSFQKPDSRHITIIPESSVVPKGETVQAQVIFYPTVETSIESCVSLLQLTNGPKFPFTFSGLGRRPALRFSSQKIEFGHCFLHQEGLEAPSYMLKLVNEDASDISFDLLFDNKPHLEVDATPAILKPGDGIDIKVTFMPREVTSYSETLAFEVNGMYTINVNVSGEGEERLVQLANPAQSTMDLGSVLVNSMQNRTFKIVNKSHANAKCSLAESAKALLERSITIRPPEFNLRGKTSIDVEMFFSPKSRMAQFSSDVVLNVSGSSKQLMVISGRATGLETKLETDTLFFGAVVANSRAVRRVALENTGDVGARFKWDTSRFAPAFSVKPAEGFLQSHGEITFEVSFHPTEVNDDIRYEKIPLSVEGGDGHALTLTGMCVTQAPVAEPISFNVAARQLQTKPSPAVSNPTDVPWTIKPVFDHEYWSGAETLDIPAGKSVTYDIKFKPLAMAAADKPHKGSLFLPLPNGTALLYQLVGVVGEPPAEGEMDLTTKAKEALVIPIKAANWLKRSQRFKVTIELDSSNPAVSLKGPEFIDVPGLLQRECKLKFYSYVEGAFKAKVTLANEDTNEFQFFKVAIKATTADVFGKASIEACVRSSTSHSFSIDNSLSADVTLKCSSNNPDVRVPPTLVLPARSTRTLDVKYRPLLAGQGNAKVEATCAELGTFVFDVAVKAAAAGADRSLSFRAPLGNTDVQTFRFNHLLADKAEYKVTVDGTDFIVDSAAVSAPAAASDDGAEVSVDVRFEPTGLGERNGRLVLSSPAAGDFICILKGSAQPPRPQGPIEVKAAGGATVNFKNVYPKATTFTVTCDNPAFAAANKGGEFAPKANQAIALTFKAPAPGASAIGKLQISGGGSTWVYYLKGV